MKKITMSLLCTGMLALSACTSHVSRGIDDNGVASEVIFPKQDKAWVDEGTFPNLDNLRKIGPGVTKEDLYYLVGRPHFSEAQHAREWDYIFKFKQADGSTDVCQYKVVFDKDKLGQSFHWLPENCANHLAVKTDKPVIAPVVAPVPVKSEVVSFGTDVLFAFDKSQPQDILTGGRQRIAELADKIKSADANYVQIQLQGHTDRLGDEAYNQQLSQQRANTVRKLLIDFGVPATSVSAQGYGESQPVKQCAGTYSRGLVDCLTPNRRVDVVINYFK